MKLYTLFTDSHSELLQRYFLPSLFKVVPTVEVVVKKVPQLCETATYGENGWFETMLFKALYHIQSCEETLGDYFIYMDCDIQFFRPFIHEMVAEMQAGNYDLACQDDVFPFGNRPTYCAGLFICKSSDRTLRFFNSLYNSMLANQRHKDRYTDQIALNENLDQVKHGLLSHKFYTIAHSKQKLWDKDYNISVPSDLLVHHANWTHGIENKIALLNFIKEQQNV